jgi:hypothetical protein
VANSVKSDGTTTGTSPSTVALSLGHYASYEKTKRTQDAGFSQITEMKKIPV